jgi:hypothetical protein
VQIVIFFFSLVFKTSALFVIQAVDRGSGHIPGLSSPLDSSYRTHLLLVPIQNTIPGHSTG